MLLSGEIFEIAAAPATNWLCHLIMNYLSVASLRPTVWWLLYAAFTISSIHTCLFTCFILPFHSNLINHRGGSNEKRHCILESWVSSSYGWLAWNFERRRYACTCEVTSDPGWGIASIAATPQSVAVRGGRDGEKPGGEWIISRQRQTESIANEKKKKDCYVNRLSGGTQSKAVACICRMQTSPCISACFWRWIIKKCYSPLIASIGWCPIPPFFLIPLISCLFLALSSSLSSCSPARVAFSQTTSLCELVFHDLFLISCQHC